MVDVILVLNAGSSSIKFAVYKASTLQRLMHGQVTGVNSMKQAFESTLFGQQKHMQTLDQVANHQQAIAHILEWVELSGEPWQVVAAGHRVVHGGPGRDGPVLTTPTVLEELRLFEPLAPQHQRHNLAAITAVSEVMLELPQAACFDTAFHANQAQVHRLLPLPQRLRDRGLMRYGFHGLSYEYLLGEVPKHHAGLLPENLLIAHLGNGASVCAIKNGQSLATTMGFSTLDGLIMGSRCGSIDPGALLHLLTTEKMDAEALTDCLYEQSGLLGLSGISSDMRELQSSNNKAATLAIDAYVLALVKHIMGLIGMMEGLDAIVFSGGVGENSVLIREQVLTRLQWLGCELDSVANQQGAVRISAEGSQIIALVIPTNEELVIARHTQALCAVLG